MTPLLSARGLSFVAPLLSARGLSSVAPLLSARGLSSVAPLLSARGLSSVAPLLSARGLSSVAPLLSARGLSFVAPLLSARGLSSVAPLLSARGLSSVAPLLSARGLSSVAPLLSARGLSSVAPLLSARGLSSVAPLLSARGLSSVAPLLSARGLSFVAPPPSLTGRQAANTPSEVLLPVKRRLLGASRSSGTPQHTSIILSAHVRIFTASPALMAGRRLGIVRCGGARRGGRRLARWVRSMPTWRASGEVRGAPGIHTPDGIHERWRHGHQAHIRVSVTPDTADAPLCDSRCIFNSGDSVSCWCPSMRRSAGQLEAYTNYIRNIT